MTDLTYRDATDADLAAVVAMLADDHLGAQRESPGDLAPYHEALAAMDANPLVRQIVVEADGVVVATMQLTRTPGLSRQGMWRLQIEGVRVHRDHRSGGIGSDMMQWAIKYGRDHDCGLIELTTDASREAAHRFYARRGFTPSHLGFKMRLD